MYVCMYVCVCLSVNRILANLRVDCADGVDRFVHLDTKYVCMYVCSTYRWRAGPAQITRPLRPIPPYGEADYAFSTCKYIGRRSVSKYIEVLVCLDTAKP